jgi:hypothetical protein
MAYSSQYTYARPATVELIYIDAERQSLHDTLRCAKQQLQRIIALCKRAYYKAYAQPGVVAGLSVLKVYTCCSRLVIQNTGMSSQVASWKTWQHSCRQEQSDSRQHR